MREAVLSGTWYYEMESVILAWERIAPMVPPNPSTSTSLEKDCSHMQATTQHFLSCAVQPATSYLHVINDNTQTHRCHHKYLPEEIWCKGNASGNLRNSDVVWSLVTVWQKWQEVIGFGACLTARNSQLSVGAINSLWLGWSSALQEKSLMFC